MAQKGRKGGTYYLGRVVKTGALDASDIKRALLSPKNITRRGYAWTFLDVQEFHDGRTSYFFGRLGKYDPEAQVSVVDPDQHKESQRRQPNMTRASSPFLYVPDQAGLSFLHISNQIEHTIFMKRWAEVVNASHEKLLARCDVDPIVDLRSFAIKLKGLDNIYHISATVSPPNPLFGPLWKNLKEYLEERNTDRMKVEEDCGENETLTTDLADHVSGIVEQTEENPYKPKPLPIGDAGVLMAADGYGTGFVRGKQDQDTVTIKTSETVRNFSFARDPDPEKLYSKTVKILDQVKEERHMEH